jgi:hypothetical protein
MHLLPGLDYHASLPAPFFWGMELFPLFEMCIPEQPE